MLKSAITKLIDIILYPIYGKKQFQSFFGFLHSISIKGMNMRHKAPSINGEQKVIKLIRDYYEQKVLTPVIFDVGANQGSYSSELINAFDGKLNLVQILFF
jgi:hypothetical protein